MKDEYLWHNTLRRIILSMPVTKAVTEELFREFDRTLQSFCNEEQDRIAIFRPAQPRKGAEDEQAAAISLAAKLFLVEPFVDTQKAENQCNRTRKPTFSRRAIRNPKILLHLQSESSDWACNSVCWKPPKISVAVLKRVTG